MNRAGASMNISSMLQNLQSQLGQVGTLPDNQSTQLNTLLDSFSSQLESILATTSVASSSSTTASTKTVDAALNDSLLSALYNAGITPVTTTGILPQTITHYTGSTEGNTGNRMQLGNLVYDVPDFAKDEKPIRTFALGSNGMVSLDLDDPYSIVSAVEVYGVDRTELRDALLSLVEQQFPADERQNYLQELTHASARGRGKSFNGMNVLDYLNGSIDLTNEQQRIISADSAAEQRRLERDALIGQA